MKKNQQKETSVIQITENNGRKAVMAKDLYLKLGNDKTHWKRWYEKNITKNRFALEGEDYEVFAMMAKTPNDGRPSVDFILSIDFAKRLAMLSRTEVGEKIRRYFIEVEKSVEYRYIHGGEVESGLMRIRYFLKDSLVNGDGANVAREFCKTEKYVSAVKCGRVYNSEVLNALVDKGIQNIRECVDGSDLTKRCVTAELLKKIEEVRK